MKITNIKIEKFSAQLNEPFRVAFGVIEQSDNWTVKISTDDSKVAVCVIPTNEELAICRDTVEVLSK